MRKILAFGLALVFILGFAATVSASPRRCAQHERHGAQREYVCVDDCRHNHFWDADGNFLSRADVEANLDAAVAAGTITAEDRAFILERYDFCAVYGCRASGVRCGAGQRSGRGAGRAMGRCR